MKQIIHTILGKNIKTYLEVGREERSMLSDLMELTKAWLGNPWDVRGAGQVDEAGGVNPIATGKFIIPQ